MLEQIKRRLKQEEINQIQASLDNRGIQLLSEVIAARFMEEFSKTSQAAIQKNAEAALYAAEQAEKFRQFLGYLEAARKGVYEDGSAFDYTVVNLNLNPYAYAQTVETRDE